MPDLILTLGIPGCGKTTWTKDYVDASQGKVVNINRDDLRWMLNNYKFANDIESLITDTRDHMTELALAGGKDVIWSDTNLNPKNRKRAVEIAQKFKGTKVVIKDMTDVPLEVCIERNSKRPNPVPEKVIRQMHKTYVRVKTQPSSLTPAIICDLDGTLALCDGIRSPYAFKLCYQDEVNEPILEILNTYWPAFARIIFITGRQEECREETVAWLKDKCNIDFGYDLYMSPNGEKRSSPIVKTEIYENNVKGKFNVLFVLEDRKKNVAEWRRLGITCLQNDEGDF